LVQIDNNNEKNQENSDDGIAVYNI